MRCTTYRRMIALDVGGDLAPAESRSLQEHIESCPACRDLQSELQSTHAGIQRLGFSEVEPERVAAIREKVRSRIEQQRRQAGRCLPARLPLRATPGALRPRLALAAAILVIAAAGVTFLGPWSGRSMPRTSELISVRPLPAPTHEARSAPEAPDHARQPPAPSSPRPTTFEARAPERERPRSRVASAPDPSPLAPTGGTGAPAPRTSTSGSTVLRLVSDTSDVVIYWVIEPNEPLKES